MVPFLEVSKEGLDEALGAKVGLHALGGLFQPQWFYEPPSFRPGFGLFFSLGRKVCPENQFPMELCPLRGFKVSSLRIWLKSLWIELVGYWTDTEINWMPNCSMKWLEIRVECVKKIKNWRSISNSSFWKQNILFCCQADRLKQAPVISLSVASCHVTAANSFKQISECKQVHGARGKVKWENNLGLQKQALQLSNPEERES